MIVEIVILAMIAAFLGLRLYSVLGRRAEHEEENVPTRFDQGEQAGGATGARRAPQLPPPAVVAMRPREWADLPPLAEQGLRQIAAADRRFDLRAFAEGAKAAYGMILEAFWRGDRAELAALCAPDVLDGFVAAIDAREAAGETLDNRLIRIEEMKVHSASVEGRTARITIWFRADIAAVTRDKDGNVVAGSLNDAVESQDSWTFSRSVDSGELDWLLEEADVG